jgi:hypothetical protein
MTPAFAGVQLPAFAGAMGERDMDVLAAVAALAISFSVFGVVALLLILLEGHLRRRDRAANDETQDDFTLSMHRWGKMRLGLWKRGE